MSLSLYAQPSLYIMKKLLPLFAIAALLISIAALFISGDSQQQPNAVDANAQLQEELNNKNSAADDTPIEAIIERVAAPENEVRIISNAGGIDHIKGDPAYLKFRVVDEHGNPIPECLVSFTRKPDPWFQFDTERRLDYKLESDARVMFAVTPNQKDYLVVYHPQWLDNRFACQTPTPNEIKDLGDIVMKPAATVTGSVLDEQGQPLANASVLALVSLPGRSYDREQIEGEAVTGDDGAFLIGNLDINAYIISVQASGYDSLEQTVHCEKTPDQQTVTAHMQRGSKVTGRVLNSSGTPIVGAEIFNTRQSPGRTRTTGELFDSPETTTASDGSYSAFIGKFNSNGSSWGIDAESSGKLVITAQHPDYVEGQVEVDGYQAPDIILKSSLHMNGKVTNIVGLDKGYSSIRLETESIWNGERASGRIEEDGTFTVEDITPGVYNLTATTNLGIVKIENIDLMHSVEDFVVEMPLGPRLNFLIGDADGLPLPDVSIELELIPSDYENDDYECRAAEDGHAIIGGIPYGKYSMFVEKRGYATLHQTIDVWQENEDVNIVLYKEASLSVDTVDANNNPVARIDARLFKEDGEMAAHETTDDGGTARFKKLPAGNYQLAIDANKLPEGILVSMRDDIPKNIDDFGSLKLIDVTLIASEHESVVITIDDLYELEVSVVSNGQPLKDIRVNMEPVFDTTGLSSWVSESKGYDDGQRTNAQGLVVFSHITEGEYIITAKKRGANLDVVLLTKVVNESNAVTIDLSSGTIEGTVVDDYGQVISGCEVYLQRSLDKSVVGRHYFNNRSREADSMTATSDANGFFSFSNVPSGIWAVVVDRWAYSDKEILTIQNGENKNVGKVTLYLRGSISGNNFRQPENIDYSATMEDIGKGYDDENEYDEKKVAEFEKTYCPTLYRVNENGELDREDADWPYSDEIDYSFTRVTAGTYVIMFDEYSSQPITVKPGEDIIFDIPAE